MKVKALIALAAAFVGTAAMAAGTWTTGPNNCTTWQADLRNVFLDSTVTSGYGGLANRSVGSGETTVGNNAVVTFTLPKVADIYAINFYSHHNDGGCDGICVTSIEVYRDGDWWELENSAIEYGTKRIDGNNNGKGTTNGSLKGLFANEDPSDPIAVDVEKVRINFGMQDNNGTRYGEIEAIGSYHDETRHLTIAAIDSDFGSIGVSPTGNDGWFAADSEVTVTFTPVEGVAFLRWSGDVPEEQRNNPVITLPMDGSRSIKAYAYSSSWIYKNGKLTDGLRTFNASGATNDICITGTADLGGTNIVDLTLPIRSGKLTQISGMSGVATLYLPDTLTTIAKRAFVSQGIRKVIPFLPENVTSIGGGCFADCSSLSGSLRIGFAKDENGDPKATTLGIHDGVRSIAFQAVSVGPVVEFGPGITDILPYTCSKSGAITNLYLGGALTRIADGAFSGIGGTLKADIVFAEDAPATLSASAFGTPAARKLRFFLPWTGEEGYPGWAAFATNTSYVTPWKLLDPSVRQQYHTAFPAAQYGSKNPYGLTTQAAAVSSFPMPADQWVMARIAAEEGEWTTGAYDPDAWQASTSNLLASAVADANTPAELADGAISVASASGNVTNGQIAVWTLANRSSIYGFNVYTHAADGQRDGIHIAKIEVRLDGDEEWTDLEIPEVEFGTANLDGGDIAHEGRTGTFKASYFRSNRSELAADVVAVRITFGNHQDNGAGCYGEIEAIGASAGWMLYSGNPDPIFASVSRSPESVDNNYPAGATVVVTVDLQSGVDFLGWDGNVAEEHRLENPLTVTLTGDVSITPKLHANFLVYKGGHLFDGDEDIRASGETNAISVTGYYSLGANGLLDLNKPILGGGRIVSVSGFDACKALNTVRFPDTIESFGNRSFCQCGYFNLETGLDFPNLVSLGGASFIQDYLGKSVRLGFAQDGEGNYRQFTFVLHSGDTRSIAFESCSVGPDVILGPGVTLIPPATFNGSGNVTNLWLGPNVSSIQGTAFSGIGGTKSATVTFTGDKPTLAADAFGTPTAYRVRFMTPWKDRGDNPGWEAVITNAAKVTPWNALSGVERAKYRTYFPRTASDWKHPYGLTASDSGLPANQWLFTEKHDAMTLHIR